MLKFRDKLYGAAVETKEGKKLGKCVNIVISKDDIYLLSTIESVKLPSSVKTFLFRFPLIGMFAKPLLKRGRRYYLLSFSNSEFVESDGKYKIISKRVEEPKDYICFLHPDYGAPHKYKAVITTLKSSDNYFYKRPVLKLEKDVKIKAKNLYFRKEIEGKKSHEVVLGHIEDLLINEENKNLVVWLSTQIAAPYDMINFWDPVIVYGDGEGFYMQFKITCLACNYNFMARERPIKCPKCKSNALSVVEF